MLNGSVGLAVPIPTYPSLPTTNFVAVDEPIANAGPVMPFGLTDNFAHGVVEPIPTLLAVETKSVEVPVSVVPFAA